jgi:hypothetical protein
MRTLVRALAIGLIGVVCASAFGAEFEWGFNGDMSTTMQNGGTATMTAINAGTTGVTSFGADGSLGYMSFGGAALNAIANPSGYVVNYPGLGKNGGGTWDVNAYTMIWDAYVPSFSTGSTWQPLFNTRYDATNDGDFWVAPDGSIGVEPGGYSAGGVVPAGAWKRIAFVLDPVAGQRRYYVDGTLVGTFSNGGIDGRWSLYNADDPPPQFVLLGDENGETNDIRLGAFYFTDTVLSDGAIGALGGTAAAGIVAPEPTTVSLLVLAGLACWRRRRS